MLSPTELVVTRIQWSVAKHERQTEHAIRGCRSFEHAGACFKEVEFAGLHLRQQVHLLPDLSIGKEGDSSAPPVRSRTISAKCCIDGCTGCVAGRP